MTENEQNSSPESQNQSGGVLKAAGTVSGFTILSRILGLFRDIMSAVIFGSGVVWDSFVLAFTIPNLFRRIFGEGALTSAFLPVAVKVRKEEGTERTAEVTSAVVLIIGAVLFVTALVIAATAGIFLLFSEGGVDAHLTTGLLTVLIFYLPFICLAAVLQAALNSVKHFAVPAFTPVLLNMIWIGVLAVILILCPDLDKVNKAFILAFGVIGGGILQFIIQVPVLNRHGLTLRITRKFNQPEVRTVFKSMIPVVLALAVMQINVLVDRLLAKWMIDGDGAISALFYGNRLIQFPLAIFGIAVSVAVFPSLREFAVDRDYDRIWKTLNMGIRVLIFIIVPCSIGLIVIGRPVIDLFFNWGQFAASPQAALRVYLVVAAYSLGLLFFCFNIVITRVFHSLDNRVFPARVAGLMVLLNFCLNILFLKLTPLKEAGLALSTSITAFINVTILLSRLVKGYGYNEIRGIVPAFMKASIAAFIMGAGVVCIAGLDGWSLIGWSEGFTGKLLRVCSGIFIGMILYFGAHMIMRTPEFRELRNTFFSGSKREAV
jgi:putative peptidoglycan lipid II flippase